MLHCGVQETNFTSKQGTYPEDSTLWRTACPGKGTLFKQNDPSIRVWRLRYFKFGVPVLDPEVYATDALSLTWLGMWAYTFSPFPLILACLRKTQGGECLVCLIAPLWEGQAWYPLLLSLLVAPPEERSVVSIYAKMLHPHPRCSVFTPGCYVTTHASVRHF